MATVVPAAAVTDEARNKRGNRRRSPDITFMAYARRMCSMRGMFVFLFVGLTIERDSHVSHCADCVFLIAVGRESRGNLIDSCKLRNAILVGADQVALYPSVRPFWRWILNGGRESGKSCSWSHSS